MASNHDVGRFPSRWCDGDERKIRLALLVLATLPGTTVLYYGDEMGMTDVDVPRALRRDTATLDGGTRGNRDRARTPMPWDGSPGGGFTSPGVTPWLPMADHPVGNVASERADPDSTLWLCRRLLALRRAELGAGIADFETLTAGPGLWAYRAGSLIVAANFSDRPADIPTAVSTQAGEVLLAASGGGPAPSAPSAPSASPEGVLGPWQGVIARTRGRELSGPRQGYRPGPRQGYRPGPRQGYRPGPRQGYRPAGDWGDQVSPAATTGSSAARADAQTVT
jgi:alpha-glucosidase